MIIISIFDHCHSSSLFLFFMARRIATLGLGTIVFFVRRIDRMRLGRPIGRPVFDLILDQIMQGHDGTDQCGNVHGHVHIIRLLHHTAMM